VLSLSEEEIEKAYEQENEKAKAEYVFIDPKAFTEQIHPAYEELQDYYQNHKTKFQKPEQVNVQYIALYFEDNIYAEHINISEEEIQDYYANHHKQFSVKNKKDKEQLKPLAEVTEQIKEIITQDKIKILLEDKIWQISDEIGDDPESFTKVAKKYHLEVKETGFFGPQQSIPKIGLSYEFLNAAFSLDIGELSNVIETAKGYFLIKLKEKKQAYIPKLDQIKEEVEKAVVEQKSWQLAKDKAEELLLQIKKLKEEKKMSFIKAAEKLALTVKETEEFSRSSYIPGIGQSREFTQAAFALKPNQISKLITVPNGYCILSLKNIIPIDKEKFAQEKEEFSQKILARKKANFFREWLLNLKEEANLVSYIENTDERR
jgi:peptidyl-prolyl cis-trans isomerase D